MCGRRQRKWNRRPSNFARRWSLMGTFEHVARWGEVWVPNNVPRAWRPYTLGHWVYSDDYGWYWASNIRETNNTIRPAASVPRPQPLSRNERGRLGQTPPRAASGVTQQPPQQPGTTGAAPGQQPRGVTGAQQPRQPERGAAGAPPEQQRGLRERGATGP